MKNPIQNHSAPTTLAEAVVRAMRSRSVLTYGLPGVPALAVPAGADDFLPLLRKVRRLSYTDRLVYDYEFDLRLCLLRAEELNHIERLKAAP